MGSRWKISIRVAGLGLVALALAAGASARPQARPDLVEAKLSNPPDTAPAGERFMVTDRVRNRGGAAARRSTSAYYLIGTKRFSVGFRLVRRLGVGKTNVGSSFVVIPPSAPAGFYRLRVCADARHVVREASESDNCRYAARKLRVTKPKPPPI